MDDRRLFNYSRTVAPYSELLHPDRASISLHDVMFALSAPERLDLVRQLRAGPMAAAQCATIDPDMPKSTKSHQLKVLRESGIIRNEPDGRNRILSLRRADLDARFPGLLDAVLAAADRPEQPSG